MTRPDRRVGLGDGHSGTEAAEGAADEESLLRDTRLRRRNEHADSHGYDYR